MYITHILPVNRLGTVVQPIEMYLADLVLKYPKQHERLRRGPYRILDNSYNELGSSLPREQMLEAAKLLVANEIVLPDRECLEEYQEHLEDDIKFFEGYSTMAVVHAKSLTEAIAQCAYFSSIDKLTTIGLPKPVADLAPFRTGRVVVSYWLRRFSNKEIHFLGSELLLEEILGRDLEHVRSMDTGYFISEYGLTQSILSPRNLRAGIDLENGRPNPIDVQLRIEQVQAVVAEWGAK